MFGQNVWVSVGIFLAAVFFCVGAALIKSQGQSIKSPSEWAAWSLITAITFWVMRFFFIDGLIGSGDSYHYSLQVADFVTQLRHGIFPVLIGQSEYAFNGNVHTVRTAPYFTHLAGAVDILTAQKLSFYLIKNVTVILSAWGGAAAAYFSARILAPKLYYVAPISIAVLYVTSPGILTPLVSLDMYATFMTVPFLPLFFLGITLSLRRLDDSRPLLLTVGALAIIWYGHPPIAALLSPLLIVAQGIRIILVGAARGTILRACAGALLFSILSGYLFFSVYSLHLSSTEEQAVATRAAIAENSVLAWPETFRSVGTIAATQLKLGISLWSALVLGITLFRIKLDRVFIGGFIFVGLLLVLPIPFATHWLWSNVPAEIVTLTNNWPAQRFYPILSAAIVTWVAVGLDRGTPYSRRKSFIFAGIPLLLAATSVEQVLPLRKHSELMRVPNDLALPWIDAENVTLTRSSYLLFDSRPGYYSDSWVDPEFESRLLDASFNPRLSNSEALLQAHARELVNPIDLKPQLTFKATLDRSRDWLLVFDFSGPAAPGELTLKGPVRRIYGLPESGEELAFGSGPNAAHTLTLRARPGADPTVSILSTVPGVRVSTVPFDSHELPVQLLGLSPYRARINAPAAGFLETPAVFVPGYSAIVNGQNRPVRRSDQGLVSVPVPAGESAVQLNYVGVDGLRGSWFLALAGFISLPFLWRFSPRTGKELINWETIRQFNLLTLPRHLGRKKIAMLILATASVVGVTWTVQRSIANDKRLHPFGSLRLSVHLPPWSGIRSEPLLVTGHHGAGDCVYISYIDPTHAQIGFDHWGKGGPISVPFHVYRGPTQVIEITVGSLFPQNNARFHSLKFAGDEFPLVVSANGREVLHQASPFFPALPSEVAVGVNKIGTSTCEAGFTGGVLSAVRFIPDFLRQ